MPHSISAVLTHVVVVVVVAARCSSNPLPQEDLVKTTSDDLRGVLTNFGEHAALLRQWQQRSTSEAQRQGFSCLIHMLEAPVPEVFESCLPQQRQMTTSKTGEFPWHSACPLCSSQ